MWRYGKIPADVEGFNDCKMNVASDLVQQIRPLWTGQTRSFLWTRSDLFFSSELIELIKGIRLLWTHSKHARQESSQPPTFTLKETREPSYNTVLIVIILCIRTRKLMRQCLHLPWILWNERGLMNQFIAKGILSWCEQTNNEFAAALSLFLIHNADRNSSKKGRFVLVGYKSGGFLAIRSHLKTGLPRGSLLLTRGRVKTPLLSSVTNSDFLIIVHHGLERNTPESRLLFINELILDKRPKLWNWIYRLRREPCDKDGRYQCNR
jgi:hypothetical protein